MSAQRRDPIEMAARTVTRGRRAGSRALPRIRPTAEQLEGRSLLTTFGLDPGFGQAGTAQVSIGAAPGASAGGAAVQADGGTILAGTETNAAGQEQFLVERLDPNGVLDPGFGVGGQVAIGYGTDATAQGVAIAPDGTIVVAGNAVDPSGGTDLVVARLNPDGSPDAGFGTNGRVRIAFPGSATLSLDAVSVLADGRVAVAGSGSATQSSNTDLDLARLTASGALDPTYGSGGTVQQTFQNLNYAPLAEDTSIDAIALGADGSAFVGESSFVDEGIVGASYSSTVALFNPDGSPDPGFAFAGTGASYTAGVGASAIAVAPGGGIVVASSPISNAADTAEIVDISRHNADGSVDAAFGAAGVATLTFPDREYVKLAELGGGQIAYAGNNSQPLAGGTTVPNTVYVGVLSPGGTPDAGFGNAGQLAIHFGVSDEVASVTSIAATADGKFVVAGQAATTDNSNVAFGAARFTVAQVSGSISPASDSGLSSTDGITSVATPTYAGTAPASATIQLYATAAGRAAVLVGQTTADASGRWSVTASPLAANSYAMTAVMTTTAGVTQTVALGSSGSGGPLTVVADGPRVVATSVDPEHGALSLTVSTPDGLDPIGLVDLADVTLSKGRTTLHATASSVAGSNVVRITLAGGAKIAAGTYTLTVQAAGLRDVAGNALDGEFARPLPSGDGHPGGNFVGTIPVTAKGSGKPKPIPVPRKAKHALVHPRGR